MALLDPEDYPTIRRAISASFNEATLPAAVIADDLFLGEAEAWVASRTDDTGEHAKRACVYYTAYLLVPQVQGQLQAAHNMVGGAPSVNWRALQDELLRRAEREIAAITSVEVPKPQVAGTTTVGITPRF